MEIIIIKIYMFLWIISKLGIPLLFGREKKPYSYKWWILDIIFEIPLIWALYIIITK